MAVPEPLLRAIKLAREKAVETTDTGLFASIILPHLEAAAAELSTGAVKRPARRGTGEMTYVVETTQQGEVLTEQRGSGRSKPYRCPKRVYEGLAAVLAAADRPLLLDEIVTALERQTGERPADHQVRVALRLWTHVAPPLVSRNRARYRATDGKPFTQPAVALWHRLAKPT